MDVECHVRHYFGYVRHTDLDNLIINTKTVEVKRVSDLATEREIHEFFSFSGEIEHIEIRREPGQSKTAFVRFKDPKALEIALLLSGATIVDQIREVRIVENAVSMSQETSSVAEGKMSPNNGRVYVSKAQDAVSSMLAKGSTIGQALMAAERKINDTGSTVKSSRYVTSGTAWLSGALNKVAKAGQVAGTKTREKWNLTLSNLSAKDRPIAA
ncbi:hypothetical protein DH2020_019051 [Rehmannia glutinosa]|uniref:RRM domain-containing protein n=1 Tax=Rehmannia glutinosa TaxID=99300 RepID=A0ABR0WP54_REHGL